MRYILLFTILILLVGCGDDDTTIQALYEETVSCKENTQKARDHKDADLAEDEAEKAQDIAEEVEKRLKEKEDITESEKELLEKILINATSAQKIADLAREDEELADLVSSWKAAAYRKTRLLTIKGLFLGLAVASDQAESKGLDKLPEKLKEGAEWGASLVHYCTGRGMLENGDPDWKEISEVLRELEKEPPPEICVLLAVSSAVSGQKRIALYEIELLDKSKIEDEDRKLIYMVIRSVILSMNGLHGLAVESLENTINELESTKLLDGFVDDDTISKEDKPKVLLSMMHIVMGYFHFQEKKFTEVDRDVARALKVWPNNPMTVFLTGEVLLANGKTEEAAKSLEKAAKTVDVEWLAKLIAQRAKEIRDGKGRDESLVLNAKVLGGAILTFTIEYAKDAKWNASLIKWLKLIRDFSGKMMGIELSSEPEEDVKEDGKEPGM
jgi:hypothetical protein